MAIATVEPRMDSEDVNKDVVHPEVRAHINSLVSAVSSVALEDGVFGHDLTHNSARRVQYRR